MNILYITHDSNLFGSNRSLLDIITYIDRLNFKIRVITPTDGDLVQKLRLEGVECEIIKIYKTIHSAAGQAIDVSTIWNKLKTNYLAVKEIVKCIKNWNIDIIHTNTSVINLGAIAANITHKPHIWHIRELPIQFEFVKDFEKADCFLMKRSAKLICISRYVRDEIRKEENYNNIELLYNPIDTKNYAISRKYFFSSDVLNILVCGAVSKNKGQMDVVRAVKILHERGYGNITLTIVGKGAYFSVIEKYVEKYKMSGFVYLHPFTDNIQEYRNKADIAVMSSVYEALGRVTIESMLSELLVIGADSGATSELIQDGYNGLKYEPHNSKQLAERIEYVMKNKDNAIEIIKRAKRFALHNFDARKQIKQIEKIYYRIGMK